MRTASKGQLLMIISTAGFLYYSFWLLVTPLIEEGQPLLRFFPDRYYAPLPFVVTGIITLCSVAAYVGCALL